MRLRELITEVKVPEIKIGKHKIKIVGSFKSGGGLMGSNPQAVIEFNGKKLGVFKQGMIGIWAFPQRPKLNRKEEDAFDKFMDDNIGKARKLPRATL